MCRHYFRRFLFWFSSFVGWHHPNLFFSLVFFPSSMCKSIFPLFELKKEEKKSIDSFYIYVLESHTCSLVGEKRTPKRRKKTSNLEEFFPQNFSQGFSNKERERVDSMFVCLRFTGRNVHRREKGGKAQKQSKACVCVCMTRMETDRKEHQQGKREMDFPRMWQPSP